MIISEKKAICRSAIEQKSDHAKIFCVPKIYLKKEELKIVDGERRNFGRFRTCTISYVFGNKLIL
jgi:hypothetical protein